MELSSDQTNFQCFNISNGVISGPALTVLRACSVLAVSSKVRGARLNLVASISAEYVLVA